MKWGGFQTHFLLSDEASGWKQRAGGVQDSSILSLFQSILLFILNFGQFSIFCSLQIFHPSLIPDDDDAKWWSLPKYMDSEWEENNSFSLQSSFELFYGCLSFWHPLFSLLMNNIRIRESWTSGNLQSNNNCWSWRTWHEESSGLLFSARVTG